MGDNGRGGTQFLFFIPVLAVFCGFFLPLAEGPPGWVFRGKELFELYWRHADLAPPPAGFGLVVSLFRLIPFLALPAMAVSLLGWRETPCFAAAFAASCLALAFAPALPGFGPSADVSAAGRPGPGYFLIVVASCLLLLHAAASLAGAGGVAARIENAVRAFVSRHIRQCVLFLSLLGIWGVFYAASDRGVFLSSRNLSTLFLQSAASAVIAAAVVLILVAGHIDLSVGSVVGFVGAVAAVAQVDSPFAARLSGTLAALGVPPGCMALVGAGAALLVGVAIGAWHGTWIAYLGVPAFIVTLSGMMIFRGGLLLFTGGKSIANMHPWFQAVGQNHLSPWNSFLLAAVVVALYLAVEQRRRRARRRYGFPVPPLPGHLLRLAAVAGAIAGFFAIMIAYRGIPYAWLVVMTVAAGLTFIAEKTTFGRQLYAIGGNPEAARISGVDIRKKVLHLYMLAGTVTAVGGVIYLSRLNSATASAGGGMELDCIAAAVIGGASLMGGEGAVYGGVVGALVMGSLDNGMSLLDLDATWQYMVKGLVLLLAVFVDIATRRRQRENM